MPELVADIFGRLDDGVARAVRNCRLVGLWGQVVDERVGRHTEAVKIASRILFVSTSSPVWAQELTFLKPALIARFNELAGDNVISDIKFK